MQETPEEIYRQLAIVVGLTRTLEPIHRRALEQIAEEYGDDALDMTVAELKDEMDARAIKLGPERCKAALERYKAAFERYKDL